jgi:hypothetical protein
MPKLLVKKKGGGENEFSSYNTVSISTTYLELTEDSPI